jgi:hypothetical protein
VPPRVHVYEMSEKYTAYRDGDPTKTKRCWSVFEDDGSQDGRLVATKMTEEDALKVAALLNRDG